MAVTKRIMEFNEFVEYRNSKMLNEELMTDSELLSFSELKPKFKDKFDETSIGKLLLSIGDNFEDECKYKPMDKKEVMEGLQGNKFPTMSKQSEVFQKIQPYMKYITTFDRVLYFRYDGTSKHSEKFKKLFGNINANKKTQIKVSADNHTINNVNYDSFLSWSADESKIEGNKYMILSSYPSESNKLDDKNRLTNRKDLKQGLVEAEFIVFYSSSSPDNKKDKGTDSSPMSFVSK